MDFLSFIFELYWQWNKCTCLIFNIHEVKPSQYNHPTTLLNTFTRSDGLITSPIKLSPSAIAQHLKLTMQQCLSSPWGCHQLNWQRAHYIQCKSDTNQNWTVPLSTHASDFLCLELTLTFSIQIINPSIFFFFFTPQQNQERASRANPPSSNRWKSSTKRATHRKNANSTGPSSTATPSRAWWRSSGRWASSGLTLPIPARQ